MKIENHYVLKFHGPGKNMDEIITIIMIHNGIKKLYRYYFFIKTRKKTKSSVINPEFYVS